MAAAMKLNSLVRRASSSIIPRRQSTNGSSAIFPLNSIVWGRQFLRFSTAVVDYNTDYNVGSLVNLVFERTSPDIDLSLFQPPEYHLTVKHGDACVPVIRKVETYLTRVVVLGDTYQVNKDGIPNVSVHTAIRLGDLRIKIAAIAEPEVINIQTIKMWDSLGHLRFLQGYLSSRDINTAMICSLLRCFQEQT